MEVTMFSFSERQQLLDEASKRIPVFRGRTIDTTKNNISAPAGKDGSEWVIVTRGNDCRVELFLGNKNSTKIYFQKMEKYKANIESEFGEKLYWDFKQNRKNQYIKTIDRSYKEISGKLDEVIRYLIERMIKFMSIVGVYWDKVQRADGKSKEENNIQPKDALSVAAIPTEEEIKAIYREIAKPWEEIPENLLKESVEKKFARQGRKLRADWWEITKRNLIAWSKKG
jgi:hypothetical protein